MSWMTDHPALVWLGVALLLAVVEVATGTFFFLMLALASLAGMLAAALGVFYPGQIIAAVLASFILLGVLRPQLIRRIGAPGDALTGTASLVGQLAVVVEHVTPDGGRVKLAGELWSARTEFMHPPVNCPIGQRVLVTSIDGATAVVSPELPTETEYEV